MSKQLNPRQQQVRKGMNDVMRPGDPIDFSGIGKGAKDLWDQFVASLSSEKDMNARFNPGALKGGNNFQVLHNERLKDFAKGLKKKLGRQ